MGFRYRKSKNIGPFRINLSKSGVGWSVGGKGFRYTKKANGGTRSTTSIPGTGMSWVKDYSNKSNTRNNKKNIVTSPANKINKIEGNRRTQSKKTLSTKSLIIIAFVIIFLGLII